MADWTQRGSILSLGAGGVDFDQFGQGVSISKDGNVLAVGAWGWDSSGSLFQDGKVLVYDKSGSSWTLRATVQASDAASNDNFGYSVALNSDGTVLVVGARAWEGASSNVGGVYTYDWSGSAYTARGSVLAVSGSGHTNLNFGTGVALSSDGTILVVGASGGDTGGTNRGAVYTFDVSGSSWTQRGSVLQAADAANSDAFGQSVALNADGTILAVGATAWEGASGTDRGGVYIFDVSGSSWTQRGSVLEAPGATNADAFGVGVALNGYGSRLFVGMRRGASGTQRGAIYQFDYDGSWTQTGSAITASDAADSDLFYMPSTDDTGGVLVVGAPQWEDAGISSAVDIGAVYTFDYTAPPDGSGAITIIPAVSGSGDYTNSAGASGSGAITIYPAGAGVGTFPTNYGSGAASIAPTAAGVARIDVGWDAALSSAPSRIAAALAVFGGSWSAALASPSSQVAAEAASGALALPCIGIGYSASGMDRGGVSGTTITVAVDGVTWPAARVSIRKSLEVGDGEQPYGYESAEVAIPYTQAAFAALFAAARSSADLEITAHYTLDNGASYIRSLGLFALTRASRPTGAGAVVLAGERVTVYGVSDDVLNLSGVSYETARSIRCAVDHQVFPGQEVAGNAAYFVTSGVTITLDAANNAASMEVFGG